jgi:hypothetical protein
VTDNTGGRAGDCEEDVTDRKDGMKKSAQGAFWTLEKEKASSFKLQLSRSASSKLHGQARRPLCVQVCVDLPETVEMINR